MQKICDTIEKVSYGVVGSVGAVLFLVLTYYSFFYSDYILPYATLERAWEVNDCLWLKVLLAGAFFCFFLLLKKAKMRLSEKAKTGILSALTGASTLWIFGAGYCWINAFDRVPLGDPAYIYGGASYIIEGNFMFFGRGCYFEFYPHQLGLTALMEALFRLVGTYRYDVYQLLCVFLAAGLVPLGLWFLKACKTAWEGCVLFVLLMAACIPLLCYTSWVYGDIPSLFFMFLGACAILHLCKTKALAGRLFFLFLLCFSTVMALLVRQNSLLYFIALGILGLVFFVKTKKKAILPVLLLSLVLPFLVYAGINYMYEVRSGYAHGEGLPASSYIAMGLQEFNGMCGWYNDYNKEVFYENDMDYALTDAIAKAYIAERLTYFKENMAEAAQFFKAKILTQWNEPLYQGIYFSTVYTGEAVPEEGSFLAWLYDTEGGFFQVLAWADVVQLFIYGGTFFYYATCYFGHKKKNPLELLLAVTILGGFFFSILWEAKARYIFVYYVMMFPLASIGYCKLLGLLETLYAKLCKKPQAKVSQVS